MWKKQTLDRGVGYTFYTKVVGNRKFRVFTDSLGRYRVQFSVFDGRRVLVYEELSSPSFTRSNEHNMKVVDTIISHIPHTLFGV